MLYTIENAKINAERMGVKNAEFICGDAGTAAAELEKRGTAPDVIILDPPSYGRGPNGEVWKLEEQI